MLLDVGASSDVGRVRAQNEDCFCVRPEEGLLVVADGMGGQAGGEIASAIAVEALTTHCLQAAEKGASYGPREPGQNASPKTARLVNAARWANRKIRSAASKDPAHSKMGATLVAAWLEGQHMSLVNVGDSRAYLLSAGVLRQLTTDHSLAGERARRGFISKSEARTSTLQSVLLRALGAEEKVEVDAQEHLLRDRDVVLLCTDGLTRMVSDSEIANTLACCGSAQAGADRLVELANQHGGRDNVTAVVLRFERRRDGVLARLRRRLYRSAS